MSTHTRILTAAEELFAERGYHATTLREVAERVGITKPALYYHFESKSEILGSLLDPMTRELEQVLTAAIETGAAEGMAAMRRVLLTGWLEVFLRSRGALLALFRDLASMPPALYHRLLLVLERAVVTGAGPNATAADQVTMAQAITAITDPVALVPQIPTEELRKHLLAGVWRLIGEPPHSGADQTPSTLPPQPATTAGTGRNDLPGAGRSRGGRPKALSPDAAERVRELHASGEHTADSIAALLGVSRATVYRYLKTQF